MIYKVNLTGTAKRDIKSASDYITYNLFNPSAADDLLDDLSEKVSALGDNPMIYPVIDDPVLKEWGIRFFSVKNYLAFYTVTEAEKMVYIIRFIFKRRDWNYLLQNINPLNRS